MKRAMAFILFTVLLLPTAAGAWRHGAARTVYVPSPACTYGGGLTWVSRLQVRNMDPYLPFSLESVEFRGPDGSLVKSFLDEPVQVEPWSSLTFLASPWSVGDPGEEVWFDIDGGRPFFLVRYDAGRLLNEPSVSATKLGIADGVAKTLDNSGAFEVNYAGPGPWGLQCGNYRSGVVYVGSGVGVQAAGSTWVTRVVVRNLDPFRGMAVQAVDFYDPQGALLKRLLPAPQALEPFESATYLVTPSIIGTPEYPYWIDNDGPRPFIIVQWASQGLCNQPMVGAAGLGVTEEGLLETFDTFAGRLLKMWGGYNPVW